MLNNYSLVHTPSPKDKNRYKLNLSGTEEDVKKIMDKLGGIGSRPFPSPDKNYQWSLFLYDLNESDKDKLKIQLDKVVASGKRNRTAGDPSDFINGDGKLKKPSEKAADEVKKTRSKIGSEYTFETFVVGANTRFTYAACKSVAENPGKNYNPLFIYGGVGLGKTHLMHAIGNYVMKKFPEFNEVYITTDRFINEVVEALEKGNLKEVKAKYKAIDLLLIDDIQFLEQSESTQEEFFHIFNAMHEVGKQIVITSDKPPKKLTTLEDRLKSRFEWGLTTDIKTPNLETRKAILKKKANKLGLSLDEDISNYIAERLTSNVRELEGIINRICAYGDLSDDKITLELVKDIIKNILPAEAKEIKKKQEVKKVRTESPLPPPAPPVAPYPAPIQRGVELPPIPQQLAASSCSRCMTPLTFMPQYQRWYCSNCRMYMDPVIPPPAAPVAPSIPTPYPGQFPAPQKSFNCTNCSGNLRYISKYERYYCDSCGQYEPGAVKPPDADSPEVSTAVASPPEPKPEPKPEPSKVEAPVEKKGKIPVEINFESKIIGEKRKELREIKTGYFLPEGAREKFSIVVDKLSRLTTQKKFNFYIKPLFVHYYLQDININYDKIAHLASTNDIDIALCMEPGRDSSIDITVFKDKISKAMEKVNMPHEMLPQKELKESDALNLMLDIAICAKKDK